MFFFCTTEKFANHKGRNRRFTNPEELEEQRKREENERQWRVNFTNFIFTKLVYCMVNEFSSVRPIYNIVIACCRYYLNSTTNKCTDIPAYSVTVYV